MKILFIPLHGGGVQYYRQAMPARALADAGHEVTYFNHELGFFQYLVDTDQDVEEFLLKAAGEYDVVHMAYTTVIEQVTLINGALRNCALQLHDKQLPIITDIDDDPMSVPVYNTSFKKYTPQSKEFKCILTQLQTSDVVTVTRREIEESIGENCKVVEELPNYLEPSDWDYPVNPRRADDNSVRVMFTGGHGHKGDLDEVQEAIEWMVDRYDGVGGKPHVKLIFLGCTPPWAAKWLKSASDPVKNRAYFIQPCDPHVYRQILRWVAPDILFTPIQPNQFNRSKSDIKAYDAAMGGAAFLCTDYDTYDAIPNEVACKATSPMQWKEYLAWLIENPVERKAKAAALKAWVLENRQIKDHIYRWEAVYKKALGRDVIKSIEDVVTPEIVLPGD